MDQAKALSGRSGVYISTYGCQMNVNDTDRMYALLEMINYSPVNSADQADLIIINSCSVREKPVHKVHSEAGRYRKLKNKNPHLRIGVAGCVGQQEKGQLLKDVPVLDFVFGPDNIDSLPQMIQNLKSTGEKQVHTKFDHQSPYHIETLIQNPGVSSFVNITKGCDNFCTFCVVPFTRGRERSRPLKHLIADVNQLVKRGVKEVTLVGQNVNSYRSDCGADFAALLNHVARETDIERIRYTTPHPKDFDEALMRVMEANRDKICEYVHLPVQSGNSEILKQMNRGYTREEYIDKVRMIQDVYAGAVFSSDIIVGFPGETEAQFQDTMSLLDVVPYETLFAFNYSPRPFTKAAQFSGHISKEVSSRRLSELLEKHKTLAFEMAKKYESQTLRVLVEGYGRNEEDKSLLMGRSTQNKKVHFKFKGDGDRWIGQTVPVKIEKAYPATFHGIMGGNDESN